MWVNRLNTKLPTVPTEGYYRRGTELHFLGFLVYRIDMNYFDVSTYHTHYTAEWSCLNLFTQKRLSHLGSGARNMSYGTVTQKLPPHGYIIKCYKIASRLDRYNFPTVNAINVLFSTLHTTPCHYGETVGGALHQFHADATRSDTQ